VTLDKETEQNFHPFSKKVFFHLIQGNKRMCAFSFCLLFILPLVLLYLDANSVYRVINSSVAISVGPQANANTQHNTEAGFQNDTTDLKQPLYNNMVYLVLVLVVFSLTATVHGRSSTRIIGGKSFYKNCMGQTWGDWNFPNVMITITIILLCYDYDYDYTTKL